MQSIWALFMCTRNLKHFLNESGFFCLFWYEFDKLWAELVFFLNIKNPDLARSVM